MEGTGTVKIKNEEKPTSFKYIRDRLSGNENGVEVSKNLR